MNKEQFDTPILFLIFNRPFLAEKVFAQIRKVKPKQLFIAADGPRSSQAEDKVNCTKTRQVILEMIDWECDLKSLFHEENLGCGLAVSKAITWFFDHVEMGIILEDDIFASESFFYFAEQMLNKYKNDPQKLFISGSNFQLENKRGDGDYYYSQFPNTWGWATWKSRWKLFDYNLDVKQLDDAKINELSQTKGMEKLWKSRLCEIQENRKNIWDFQWFMVIPTLMKVSIVPNSNLVKNQGIGLAEATNTHSFSLNYKNVIIHEITPPYKIPTGNNVDKKADIFHYRMFYHSKITIANRLRNLAYNIIPEGLYRRIKSFFGR